MKVIGVTGNSGSGKSAVSKIISDMGGYVIDADKIAHEIILKPKPAYKEIVAFFTTEILNPDGEINRRKLGEKVFSDKKSLDMLNGITHKYIKQNIIDTLTKEKCGRHLCIIIDAPLLFETDLNKFCDSVWLIYADKETAVKRIAKRDNITKELALKRLDNQTSTEEYKKISDIAIENSKNDKKELEENVKKYLAKVIS